MAMTERSMAIVRAWLDEGPAPQLHRAAQKNLSKTWPTLYRAVTALVDEHLLSVLQAEPDLDDMHFNRSPGPHMWEICDACNYDTHTCHFCGDSLTHTEASMKHNPPHPCYSPEALAEIGMTGVGENPETGLA